jgi:hypothetical protein
MPRFVAVLEPGFVHDLAAPADVIYELYKVSRSFLGS